MGKWILFTAASDVADATASAVCPHELVVHISYLQYSWPNMKLSGIAADAWHLAVAVTALLVTVL